MKHIRALFDARTYRQGFSSLAVAAFLTIFGFTSIGYALVNQGHPPMPSASSSREAVVTKSQLRLPAANPTAIRIPDIGVTSPLIHTGLKPDGSPEVPKGEQVDTASWLTTSVTPGEQGTAVILGHVDSIRSGPSVFYNLGKLVPGNKVYVDRQDGRTAVFEVGAVEAFDRDNYPSQEVYGMAKYPALHLITCGGEWNAAEQEYSKNIVVFAALVSEE